MRVRSLPCQVVDLLCCGGLLTSRLSIGIREKCEQTNVRASVGGRVGLGGAAEMAAVAVAGVGRLGGLLRAIEHLGVLLMAGGAIE